MRIGSFFAVQSLDAPAASSHPGTMLTHTAFGRGEFLTYGQEYRGPLIAFGVALLLALSARVLKAGFLGAASGGLGVVAGWYVLTDRLFVWAPRPLTDRLPLLAVAALAVALSAMRLTPGRGLWPPLVLSALGCGWWLAGAPSVRSEILALWPTWLVIALVVAAVGWLCTKPLADPLRPALGGFTLAAALHVVGGSWSWTMLALVPALASLAMVAGPRLPGPALLPLAVDLAAVGCACELASGRLVRGQIRAIDVAVVSPLVALGLARLLATRMRVAGRLGPLLVSLVSGAAAVALTWGIWRLRWR